MQTQSINIVYPTITGEPIDNKEAVRMIKNFKDNGGWTKTISVWFDLKTLEDIVSEIKKIGTGPSIKTGSGARIYFARYKNVDSYPEDKRGKRSLVFMPTFTSSGDPIHYDDITVEEVKKLKKEIEDENDIFSLAPYNHGDLCPNNCDGTNMVKGLS